MRTLRYLPVAAAALLALAVAPTSLAASPLEPRADSKQEKRLAEKRGEREPTGAIGPRYVPDEVIVKYRSGTGGGERADLRRDQDASLEERLPIPGTEVIELDRGASVGAAVRELERRPEVLYAQPNYLRQPLATTPNDPRFNHLWGLHNTGQFVPDDDTRADGSGTPDADIDAPEAWDLTRGSTNVKIAVVDTGVAADHPALRANMISGWDFADDDADPDDEDGHGTHVAGTIGARGNDGDSIAGVNWNAKIMPVRVIGPEGASDADIAAGFAWAAERGAKVVNASLGGPGASPVVSEAVRTHPNTLYVVAAGNSAKNNDAETFTPCNIPHANLICVAASGQRDQLSSFSHYGPSNVDLAAPGMSIWSAQPAFRQALNGHFDTGSPNWNFSAPGWNVTSNNANQRWGGYDEFTSEGGLGWAAADSPGLCFPGVVHTGCYANNVDNLIESPSFSLSGMRGCVMSSDVWLEGEGLENGARTDYLNVETTSGRGRETLDWYGGDGTLQFGSIGHDLSRLQGQSSVKLGFRWKSDGFNPGNALWTGVSIDDVKVQCRSSSYNSNDLAVFPGTSMASPHVAGVAGLLWARNSRLTVAQARTALLGSVDKKSSLTGKVGSGGRLNANQAVRKVPIPPKNVSKPTISGIAKRGSALTANRGTWSGNPAPTFTYQWQRCNSAGASCVRIAGATAIRRTLATADKGRRLRVAVTARNAAGSAAATSAATAIVK